MKACGRLHASGRQQGVYLVVTTLRLQIYITQHNNNSNVCVLTRIVAEEPADEMMSLDLRYLTK